MINKTLLSQILESQESGEPIYCIMGKVPYNKALPKDVYGAAVTVKDKKGIVKYLTEGKDFSIDVDAGTFKLSEECSNRNVGNIVYVFYSVDRKQDDFPYAEDPLPRYRKAQYKYSPLEKLSFDHKLRNKKIRLEKSLNDSR